MDEIRHAITTIRERAQEERTQFEDPQRAAALEWAAEQAEAALRAHLSRTVTYEEAVQITHHSRSSLEKMRRAGKIRPTNESARPLRFPVADLPVKLPRRNNDAVRVKKKPAKESHPEGDGHVSE